MIVRDSESYGELLEESLELERSCGMFLERFLRVTNDFVLGKTFKGDFG